MASRLSSSCEFSPGVRTQLHRTLYKEGRQEEPLMKLHSGTASGHPELGGGSKARCLVTLSPGLGAQVPEGSEAPVLGPRESS